MFYIYLICSNKEDISNCSHVMFIPPSPPLSLPQMPLETIIAMLISEEGLPTLLNHSRMNNLRSEDMAVRLLMKPEEIATLYLIHLMNQFQIKNGTKDKCIVNAQYVLRILQNSGKRCDIEVIPVVAVYNLNEYGVIINKGHMVLKMNNLIFDPSYEVSSQDPKYLLNMKDIASDKCVKSISVEIKRDIIKSWLEFQKHSKVINEGLHMLKGEEEYFHHQADFVEPFFKYM